MIAKIKKYLTLAFIGAGLLSPVAVPALVGGSVYAATNNLITSGVCQGTQIATTGGNGSGQSGNGNCGTADTSSLSTVAAKVINLFSIVVGIVAVIMIIYGGFRYITSGGESGGVSSAKNTLIYAIVGLIIVALAQFLVHFVFNTATNSVTST